MAYKQVGNEAGRGGSVTDPAAITSTVAAASPPTKAEFDALRADVVNLRGTVAALITALRSSNVVD